MVRGTPAPFCVLAPGVGVRSASSWSRSIASIWSSDKIRFPSQGGVPTPVGVIGGWNTHPVGSALECRWHGVGRSLEGMLMSSVPLPDASVDAKAVPISAHGFCLRTVSGPWPSSGGGIDAHGLGLCREQRGRVGSSRVRADVATLPLELVQQSEEDRFGSLLKCELVDASARLDQEHAITPAEQHLRSQGPIVVLARLELSKAAVGSSPCSVVAALR